MDTFVAKIYIIVSNVKKGEGCVPKVPKDFGLCKTILLLIHKSCPPNIIEGITPLYIISIQCYLQRSAEISG